MTIVDETQLKRLRHSDGRDLAQHSGYQVAVSHDTIDRDWDAFLAHTPGGHHTQSSLWAQAKTLLGWRVARVVASRAGQIVAGAQLLLRPLPLFGAIGYVPRGPVLALDDARLAELVLGTVDRIARMHRVQYLVVQPAAGGEPVAQRLQAAGFQASSLEVTPTATVLIDLATPPDDLLAEMHGKTRYNIRLGQRKGMTVREGAERDLHTFYQLLLATGQRQQFTTYSEDYFMQMWRLLSPRGHMQLFLAEYAGEAVAGLLAIAFGNTVTYWRGGWSGQHGKLHPNEVMHWVAMTWAQSQGYRYYDLEGIDPQLAEAIVDGRCSPDALPRSLTSFKVGFGGQVELLPKCYEYVYNPLLRWSYARLFPKIAHWPLVAKIENAVRGASHS